MRWLLHSRRRWMTAHALWCCAASLIAAALTHNDNWPLNIPLALAAGAANGWFGWRLSGWPKVRSHVAGAR